MSVRISVKGSAGRTAGVLLAGAACLIAFHVVGAVFLDGFALDLGSLNLPTPRYVRLVALWTAFGAVSASLLAIAVSQVASARIDRPAAEWSAVSERHFLICASVAAAVIPLSLRFLVLAGAPLTDDEGAYRFAAELLGSGRLWVSSPPMKVFVDQNFMINDGRLYPVYSLGWPALLSVGVRIGKPWIVNPLLSAMTVPPLLGILRRFVGPAWARGGVLLFLSAPFVQIAAATELSHTSCLMALTWCLFEYLRANEEFSYRHHAGFALGFALAFIIRPQSSVAIGLPLIVHWCASLRQLPKAQRLRAGFAFLLPSALLATLFLGSLWAQNGSPWRIGYARYGQYLVENDFRFTSFEPADLTTVPGFNFSQLGPAMARTALGLFRLNADLFGWPFPFGLLALALARFSAPIRVLWWMVGCYLLLMLFQRDWGIDTFGPLHAFELALPLLVLTMVGARNFSEDLVGPRVRGAQLWQGPLFAPSLLGALMATAWLGFVPVRLQAVHQIAAHLTLALRAPERAGIHHAVIFAPLPFAPPCRSVPRHFVFFRPPNDPDFRNDILWVNHLDVEADRRFLGTVAGRNGYVMTWSRDCQVALLPLSTLAPESVLPGRVRP